jgi:uncharacterized membrane protein
LSEPFVTSETTEGGGTEAPAEARQAFTSPAERFTHVLTPANETAPPPPPEPANSDVVDEADEADIASQEWPLAWLRLVEPEPPATDDEVVAAVIAAEPADADGIAHAFGLVMAAALDPEPVFVVEEIVAPTAPAVRAYYSVPMVEPLDWPAAEPETPPAADADAVSAPAERLAAAEAEETAVAEPEDPPLVSPVYVARRAARRAAAEADAPSEGQAGEGGPAAAAYVFYLAGFLLLPAVVGVIVAYNARRTAPGWLQSHYLFQIRTFWIGLVGTMAAGALLFSGKLTLAGLVLGLLLIVWMEMRSALGFINVVKLRALHRPRTWLL